MTQREINRSSELPASFDIRKYDRCAHFTGFDWHRNLSARYWRQTEVREDHPVAPLLVFDDETGVLTSTDKLPKLSAAEKAEAWLQKPIRLRTASDITPLPGGHHQVFDQSVLDLFESAKCLDPEDEAARDFLDAYATYRKGMRRIPDPSLAAAMKLLKAPAWVMLRECDAEFRSQVPVFVDLHASDDKLMDDFLAWVHATRAALGIEARSRRFDQKTFDRWHESKILAYLDLTYWAAANNALITQPVLGAALFPDEYDINLSDRVRKVVMRHAESAMSPTMLDALHMQVLEDLE